VSKERSLEKMNAVNQRLKMGGGKAGYECDKKMGGIKQK